MGRPRGKKGGAVTIRALQPALRRATPADSASARHDQHRRTDLPLVRQHAADRRAGRRLHPRAQVHPHRRADLPVRGAGAGAAAADAAAARPGRRAGHGRLRQRLPRQPAGRLRPGAVARAPAPGGGAGEVPARPERGPGRDDGLGHPADQPVPRRPGRWRLRHVVRQGPRRGPLRRRVQARQRRRHLDARRRAGAGRRRPRLPQFDPAARQRGRVRQRDDADPQPGRGAGHPRPGPGRLGDEPLHRPLGRLQDDRRDGGILGLGAGGSVRAPHRAAGGLRPAARRAQHPLAGSADGAGDAPAPLRGQGRPGVRPRQRHRPHRAGFAARAAGHRHHRQELPRRAAGAGVPGPGRARLRRHRHPRLQGRHDLAAGAGRHRRLRARAGRHRRGGGEARLHRAADEGAVLQLAGRRGPAPEHRRQVRRGRRVDPAVHRRADPGHHRRRHRPAHPAPAPIKRDQYRVHRAAPALDGGEGSRTGAPAARTTPPRWCRTARARSAASAATTW